MQVVHRTKSAHGLPGFERTGPPDVGPRLASRGWRISDKSTCRGQHNGGVI